LQSLQVPLPALAASLVVRRRDDFGEVAGDVPSSWIMVEFPKQVHLQKDVAAVLGVRTKRFVEERGAYRRPKRC
jgi:hypothetical protein